MPGGKIVPGIIFWKDVGGKTCHHGGGVAERLNRAVLSAANGGEISPLAEKPEDLQRSRGFAPSLDGAPYRMIGRINYVLYLHS